MAWGSDRGISHAGIKFQGAVPFSQSSFVKGTDEGIPVKVSAATTVAKCADGDTFHGFVVAIDNEGSKCSVRLNGPVVATYSGTGMIPGRRYLCADGAGKVKSGSTAAQGTITLGGVPGVRAVGTITLTNLPAADGTITVDDTTFTFKASADPLLDEITIGASVDACVTNIAAKLNSLNTVSAVANTTADTVVVTSVEYGTVGNSIVFTENATNLAVDGTGTLGGTTAGVNNTLVIGGQTYTFVRARDAVGEITVGATVDATLVNIATAINEDSTVASADDDADTDTVIVTATEHGVVGNSIVFTESSANLTIDGAGTLGTTTAGVDATAGRQFLVTDVDSVNGTVTFIFKQ